MAGSNAAEYAANRRRQASGAAGRPGSPAPAARPVQAALPAGGVARRPARLQLVAEHQAGALALGVQLEPEDLVVAPGVGEQLRLVDREHGAGECHLDDLLRERERD